MSATVRLRVVRRRYRPGTLWAVEGEITGGWAELLTWFRVGRLDLSEISPRLRGRGFVTEVVESSGSVARGSLIADGPVYVDGVLLEKGEAEV